MKKILTLFVLLFATLAYSQTTYLSNFDGQDQLSLTSSNIAIQSGQADYPTSNSSEPDFGNDNNGAVVNNGTGSITASKTTTGVSTFSMDIASLAGTSGNGADGSDYIEISISIDGGSSDLQIEINGNGNAQWTYDATHSATTHTYATTGETTASPSGGGSRDDDGDGINYIEITDIPAGDIVITIEMKNNSGNEYWAVDNLTLVEMASSSCDLSITESISGCDAETNGTDTYTALFSYEGGATGTYTVTAVDASDMTVGTVGGDDPNFLTTGDIQVNGIPEGTDVTLKITDGADCDIEESLTSPTCEPTCVTEDAAEHDISCDDNTSGTDTYTIFFGFQNGGEDTYTLSTDNGTIDMVTSDDPSTDTDGLILIEGATEGTPTIITFTGTSCGATSFTIASPTCEPTCITEDASENEATCDAFTSGSDTYTAVFGFENGGEDMYDYTVSNGTLDTVSLDNPSVDASGTFRVTGATEGTDITVTITGTICGAVNFTISSPTCEEAEPLNINEIHYDNSGGDVGEFVEIFYNNSTGLTNPEEYSIILYNGNGGIVDKSITLDNITPTSDAFGYYYTWEPSDIQNGAPDGIAICGPSGMIEFVSYEGTFTASGGCADGVTSTDIGVSQNSSESLGSSLQYMSSTDTWVATDGTNTKGATNDFAVPVDWLSFDVEEQGRSHHLTWKVANEVDVADYEVQISRNGKDWKSVATVNYDAKNSGVYSYNNAITSSSSAYYRIQQNDFDGKYDYSIVQKVQGSEGEIALVNTVGTHELIFNTNTYSDYQVLSLEGRVVISNTIEGNRIDISHLNSGMYVIKIDNKAFKFVKM